jgi:hypothetical protein
VLQVNKITRNIWLTDILIAVIIKATNRFLFIPLEVLFVNVKNFVQNQFNWQCPATLSVFFWSWSSKSFSFSYAVGLVG